VVTMVAGLVLLALRRRVLGGAGEGLERQGRLLDELRGMRDRGEISAAEFDAAKGAMAARLTGKEVPRPPMPPGATRAADGSLVAKPGVDLTGAPLPRGSEGGARAAGGSSGDGGL
jgi:hypothetical protein